MNKKERDKKLKILLPILLIISLFVWVPSFQKEKNRGKSSRIGGTVNISIDTNELLLLISKTTQPVQKKKSLHQNWERNPFVVKGWVPKEEEIIKIEAVEAEIVEVLLEDIDLAIVQEKSLEEKLMDEEKLVKEMMILKGIIWNKRKPSALINDDVVGIGKKMGDYEIVNILSDKVIISKGSHKVELKMNP